MCGNGRKCGSSCKLVIRLLLSRCYCFKARGVVSVVCSFVLSKGIKSFMRELTRAAA